MSATMTAALVYGRLDAACAVSPPDLPTRYVICVRGNAVDGEPMARPDLMHGHVDALNWWIGQESTS